MLGAQGRPLVLPAEQRRPYATVEILARPAKKDEGKSVDQRGLNLDARLDARVTRPVLSVADGALPQTLLGAEARLTLALTAGLEAGQTGPATDADLTLQSLEACGRSACRTRAGELARRPGELAGPGNWTARCTAAWLRRPGTLQRRRSHPGRQHRRGKGRGGRRGKGCAAGCAFRPSCACDA